MVDRDLCSLVLSCAEHSANPFVSLAIRDALFCLVLMRSLAIG
jgi:hypothetical protein